MMGVSVAIILVISCLVLAEGFAQISSHMLRHHDVIINTVHQSRKRLATSLYAAPDGMHWFVKTEQFCKSFPEVKPHLEDHRAWVRSLREQKNEGTQQHTIVSGYRVDENDRPGGGGLMIFAAKDYAAAEEFVRNDPLIANECVDWQLNKWIAETGDISIE